MPVKRAVGAGLNELRAHVDAQIEARRVAIESGAEEAASAKDRIDLSLPGVVRPETPKRIRIAGNVQDANILTRVPLEATNYHGDVLLAVIIDKEGNVMDMRVNEGHPMLIRAAMDAVKQWKYRPTLLNGAPVEVETTVKLTF